MDGICKGSPLPPLNAETLRAAWSKTYNADGKPDWSHIFPYYHPDMVFQDTIQRVEGMEAFRALCERLTSRCKTLRMDILSVAEGETEGNRIFLMDWVMTMTFRKAPETPLYGATKLTLHPDGRIVAQRDYYDLWGPVFGGIPPLRKGYARFMRKTFG